MPRNCFDLLMNYIYFGNASPGKNDKMWKIKKLYNVINERFFCYATCGSDLPIDESMTPYFGRSGCKQRIANKPIRLRYKMLVLAEGDG